MKVLSEEKSKLLAERNGWPLAYAQGNVEGEIARHSGKAISRHAMVGIDDYAQGFRAGYFERQNPGRPQQGARLGNAEVSATSTNYLRKVAQ